MVDGVQHIESSWSGRQVHLSDGPNAWPLGRMEELLDLLVRLDRVAKTAV